MERDEVVENLEIEREMMDSEDDEEVLFGRFISVDVIRFRGREMDLKSKFKYEGGDNNWTVDWICGGRDDDGERMVACDVCEVWQHTRCAGIQDDDAVPPLREVHCIANAPSVYATFYSSSDVQYRQHSFMDLESYRVRGCPKNCKLEKMF